MPSPVRKSTRVNAGEELRRRLRELEPWYHTLDLDGGIVTDGMFDLRPFIDRYGLPDVSGKRVLDVGTFDGFWAFELERRGAEVASIVVVHARRQAS